MKSAAENDDQARSPAAKRLRRRFIEMKAMIIMGRAYTGATEFRQLCSSSTVQFINFLDHPYPCNAVPPLVARFI
jgi:hypothetical protein